ncbi:MAG: CsbD family protein [Nocardioides sp.]
MGADDKIGNKIDETAGMAKEKVGDVTDDQDLKNEGRADQAKANFKQAAEKIKDVFKK